jgi:hypothetical protein
MVERSETRVIGDLPFTLKMRGSNVVDIDPKGTAIPLYTKMPDGSLVEKIRFIAEVKPLIW